MSRAYVAIDSFCGAGGLAYGLQRAGYEIGAAFDNNQLAIDAFQKNVSAQGFVADAKEVTGQALLEAAGVTGRLDLFAGGPPCQGFSKQNRGAHLGDDRNDLVFEFARLVREINPRFFLLENVDQLGKKRGRDFVARVHKELKDFDLYPHFYNSADYGLPQTRVRFVIIGKHHDVRATFKKPGPTVTKWTTLREALKGLPEPPDDYSEHPDFPNHYRAKVTKINVERFSYVPQGGGWWDIPEGLRLECHKNVDRRSGGWPDVYGRLVWDSQCPTITGGFDSFTRGRYGHPAHDRPITPREAARIQGFPDQFTFFGDRYAIRHQIGNAVPPPLAEEHGRAILKTLQVEDGLVEAPSFEDMDPALALQLMLLDALAQDGG